ncbi:hypothetical protein V3G39_15670 [Dermatophilaceae bacterium Sec6.4]|nr:hypothetical protein [Actinomycetota bacterium]
MKTTTFVMHRTEPRADIRHHIDMSGIAATSCIKGTSVSRRLRATDVTYVPTGSNAFAPSRSASGRAPG